MRREVGHLSYEERLRELEKRRLRKRSVEIRQEAPFLK